MGDGKLTAEELEYMRSFHAGEQHGYRYDGDRDVLRLLDEHASLERDLAELREAARVLDAELREYRVRHQLIAYATNVTRAHDALARLLGAEPPKAPVNEPRWCPECKMDNDAPHEASCSRRRYATRIRPAEPPKAPRSVIARGGEPPYREHVDTCDDEACSGCEGYEPPKEASDGK